MRDEAAVRRLAAAGALACLLVAGLAVAAHPRGGATWLLVVVTLVAAAVLLTSVVALLLRAEARVPVRRERVATPVPWHMLGVAALLGLLAWALARLHITQPNPLPKPRGAPLPTPATHAAQPSSGGGLAAGPWIALALGLLVLAVLVAALLQHRRDSRSTEAVETVPATPDPLAAAVEAALLDLENEDDPRRAVIKAYASAEGVLREHGLPRRPAEAPLEYLDRVLRGLGAQAGAVDRLTELFEHAAFSTHAVDSGMRAEAVGAFHGLRESFAAEGSR